MPGVLGGMAAFLGVQGEERAGDGPAASPLARATKGGNGSGGGGVGVAALRAGPFSMREAEEGTVMVRPDTDSLYVRLPISQDGEGTPLGNPPAAVGKLAVRQSDFTTLALRLGVPSAYVHYPSITNAISTAVGNFFTTAHVPTGMRDIIVAQMSKGFLPEFTGVEGINKDHLGMALGSLINNAASVADKVYAAKDTLYSDLHEDARLPSESSKGGTPAPPQRRLPWHGQWQPSCTTTVWPRAWAPVCGRWWQARRAMMPR